MARQRLAAGQGELDLGVDPPPEAGGASDHRGPDGHPWDALSLAYDELGFDDAAGADEVFWQLVLARIIEPTSKLDSVRVLEETGIAPVSYRTMKRRLPVYAKASWRESLAAACAQQVELGPASLTIVFTALAVSRWIEQTTGWTIKRFIKTLRRYRTIQIRVGEHTLTAADPLPDDIQTVIEAIKTRAAAVRAAQDQRLGCRALAVSREQCSIALCSRDKSPLEGPV